MTQHFRNASRVHPAARLYATEEKSGQLSRREFLTRATALGVTAPAAYGLLGLSVFVALFDALPIQMGGLQRVARP